MSRKILIIGRGNQKSIRDMCSLLEVLEAHSIIVLGEKDINKNNLDIDIIKSNFSLLGVRYAEPCRLLVDELINDFKEYIEPKKTKPWEKKYFYE
ncbi:hypothetical protein [Clostridium tagluense]|uniref:Uncharacterized protein n=1 Tax=Clostridium tagluense TaxID=360422 RepID=A0A401UTN8_9CLOT|nr:hypothetical protein [Clostridium tagluense]GCD12915.1 hypothetical protein Ctaglu_45380 [Clostridium tagluense]